jgi:hypothetical protein
MQRLRLPFVITVVSTAAAAAACSGNATIDDQNGTGTGTGGTGTGTGTGTGAGAGGGQAGNGSGGNPTTCPPAHPGVFETCALGAGEVCAYDVSCQSGDVQLEFHCVNGYWDVLPDECRMRYDSCPGTQFYCDTQWWMPQGTNPPSPCPDVAPAEGETCFSGDLGGVWENCGYFCGDSNIWGVATCTDGPMGSTWQYNGTCDIR